MSSYYTGVDGTVSFAPPDVRDMTDAQRQDFEADRETYLELRRDVWEWDDIQDAESELDGWDTLY